jgi:hypothetical protein
MNFKKKHSPWISSPFEKEKNSFLNIKFTFLRPIKDWKKIGNENYPVFYLTSKMDVLLVLTRNFWKNFGVTSFDNTWTSKTDILLVPSEKNRKQN